MGVAQSKSLTGSEFILNWHIFHRSINPLESMNHLRSYPEAIETFSAITAVCFFFFPYDTVAVAAVFVVKFRNNAWEAGIGFLP